MERLFRATVSFEYYAVSDDRIAFEGTSAELGRVRFEGRLDQGALATARRNLGDEGVAGIAVGEVAADGDGFATGGVDGFRRLLQ